MKTANFFLVLLILCLELAGGCAQRRFTSWTSITNPEVTAQLKSFTAEKEAQAALAEKARGQTMPAEFKKFFAAAQRGDWLAVSNQFDNFRQHAGQYEHSGKTDKRLRGTTWQGILEIWGAFDAFGEGDEKYAALFGNDIIDSIPPGSIYFGGTDPGRFIVTAMQKSQVKGDPFFTLTQNALADSTYLDYVRSMYGTQIQIPTAQDQQKCFQDYVADARRRAQNHRLKPGENVKLDAKGHVQISGQVAVMEINARLVRVIFDDNTNREFYIEESFPLDWMYPYLEPHGLIFKINRRPLAELPDEIVRRDHDYWTRLIQPMIGGWLDDDTAVGQVVAFADKVFARHDLTGFTGDRRFVQNEYVCKLFSKERSGIAGLYVWRMNHAATPDDKARMAREADLAFRQAFALCPYSPEAVERYTSFLVGQQRGAEACQIAETAAHMPELRGQEGAQLRSLAAQLRRYRQTQ